MGLRGIQCTWAVKRDWDYFSAFELTNDMRSLEKINAENTSYGDYRVRLDQT